MRVPRQDNQTTSLGVPTVAAPNIPIPGASTAGGIQLARDVQDLGKAIGNSGSDLLAHIEKRRDMEFKQQIADLRTDFSKKLNERMLSTDMEVIKDASGADISRPVGFLNRNRKHAVNIHSEFNDYVDTLAPSYLNQIQDKKYRAALAGDLYQISQDKASTVLRHESNEWNLAKEESFNSAIDEAIKGGNISIGDKAARDLASFKGVDPADIIEKTRKSIVTNKVYSYLQADNTGASANAYLDGLISNDGEDSTSEGPLIPTKDIMDLKKSVRTMSKALMAENKAIQEAKKTENFLEIVGGMIDGKFDILNMQNINKMSANGELPDGAGEAIQKFLETDELSQSVGTSPEQINHKIINSMGLDDSVVNHAKAVLSVKDSKDLNEAVMDILNDKKMTDQEGRSRAVVMLQIAKDLGISKNESARKLAYDSVSSVQSWYKKAGLPPGQGVYEFMKNIRDGMNPADAAQKTVNEELLRQGSKFEKDQSLMNSIFSVIDGSGHYSDLMPAFHAYFLKSGVSEPEAAQLANDLFSKVDPTQSKSQEEYLQNFAKALDQIAPGLKITANIADKVQKRFDQKNTINMIALDKSPAMEQFRAEHPYAYTALATAQDLGAASFYFTDGLTAGLQSYLLKTFDYELPKPVSNAGKAAAGLAYLAGFIVGLPGKVGHTVAAKVFGTKLVSGLIKKGIEAGGKTAVATQVTSHITKTALELGVMNSTITPESGLMDWRARGMQFIEGAETGAAFGAFGFISSAKYPKLTQAIRMGITSLWTGIPSTMAKQSIEEQVTQYGLGLYFGLKGVKLADAKKIQEEVQQLSKEVSDPLGKEVLEKTNILLDQVQEKKIIEAEKETASEIKPKFETGNEPALFDYLKSYIEPEIVNNMSPADRLHLGNMKWLDLMTFVDSGEVKNISLSKGEAFPSDPNTAGSGKQSSFPSDPKSPEPPFELPYGGKLKSDSGKSNVEGLKSDPNAPEPGKAEVSAPEPKKPEPKFNPDPKKKGNILVKNPSGEIISVKEKISASDLKDIKKDPMFHTIGHEGSFNRLTLGQFKGDKSLGKVGDIIEHGKKKWLIEDISNDQKYKRYHLLEVDKNGNLVRDKKDMSVEEDSDNPPEDTTGGSPAKLEPKSPTDSGGQKLGTPTADKKTYESPKTGQVRKLVSNRPAKEQPKWTDEQKALFRTIKSVTDNWEPGGKLIAGNQENGRKIRSPSTYEGPFKNIGLTQKQLQAVYKNIESGKPMTDKQLGIARMLEDYYKDIFPVEKEIANAEQNIPDESRREELRRIAEKEEPIDQRLVEEFNRLSDEEAASSEQVVEVPKAQEVVEKQAVPESEPEAPKVESRTIDTGKESTGGGSETPPPEPPVTESSGPGGKVYGLAKSTMERAVEKGLADELGPLEKYQPRPILKKKAQEVVEFAGREWERAKNIALGLDKNTPHGLSISEIFTGVRTIAENNGDISLIRELANSRPALEIAKSAGQFVKGYDPGDHGNGTTKLIHEISKERKKNVEQKLKTKDAEELVDKEVQSIKTEKKKSAPKLKDWTSFIESIQC